MDWGYLLFFLAFMTPWWIWAWRTRNEWHKWTDRHGF